MSTFGKFVSINQGVISNCYSCLAANFSFAGQNNGEIIQDISDKNIWQKTKSKKRPLMFVPEKWYSPLEKSNDVWEISNRKELLNWAQMVNIGDSEAINANIKLLKNINLHGRQWQPIGYNKHFAFKGSFDGGGKRITNLRNQALFGFNSGKICNLIVDSINANKDSLAGFVLKNYGVIECCGSVNKLIKKKNTPAIGGFVLENYGCIERCYSAGKISKFIIPFWLKLAALLIAAAIPVFYPSSLPYKTMPYDKGQHQFEEATSQNENMVSFEFNMKAEINLKAGTCKIDYINTGESQKDVVVEIQITDADCYLASGVLAISPQELKELNEKGNYNPYESWTTIAQSNLIRPGNKLESCKIVRLYGGKYLPPGQYEGRAHLVYYDPLTHNREIVENSFRLAIEVK